MKPTSYFKYACIGLLIVFSFLTFFSCEEESDTNPEISKTETEKEEIGTAAKTEESVTPEIPVTTIEEPKTNTEVPKENTPPLVTETPNELDNPPATSNTVAQKVLDLVNNERSKRGLKTIKLNTALNIAAFNHSKDMNDNNYFEHEGLDGSNFSQRSKKAKYTGFPKAENIAIGYRTAEAVHAGWMKSDGHRANILLPNITEMGLGRSGNLWTQVFGISRR